MQPGGVLTEEQVSKCLSNLGRSASGLLHVYQCLSVPGRNLTNVSILCNYVHLQKLQVPHNRIKDLSCVSHMPSLIILDASHNQLSHFFGFQPPKNLKEVNFSHNQISAMKDLTEYSSLSKLILDYNFIGEVRGLERCASLTHLSLAHNKLPHISGMDKLPLRELCLKGNLIQKIENLQTLRNLQVLDLSCNRIRSLSGLQNLHLLGTLNLERNQISDIKEASHVRDLLLLRELNLQNQPLQEQPDYRLALVFLLQHLTRLDEQSVTAEEKVSAVNKYDPPLEVVAARDHMTQVVYQVMQPQVVFDSTLPSLDAPYPMLVLIGPQACGKRELAYKLCQEFRDYFAYGACHTTRGPYYGEEDGADYHFVTEEEFQSMIQMGRFLQTVQYGGHWYGLSRGAIEGVAREGLACCVHMELEGVLSLKNSYFEPRYILLTPTSAEAYSSRLHARGLYSEGQISSAVSRIRLYAHANAQHPGFFDSILPCDNRAEAYQSLRQLVREYLGLEEQGVADGAQLPPDSPSTEPTAEPPVAERSEVNGSSDSYGRNYWNRVQTQLTPQKSSAELASIHRRQHLLREALMGKSPGAYSQLFKRCTQTAPPSLVSPTRPAGGRAHQDPNEDTSSVESLCSSGLSMRSSVQALSVGSPASGGLDAGSGPLVDPLGHERDVLKDASGSGVTPEGPPPISDCVSPSPGPPLARPGSDARPVLPPIPSGRKTAEPSPRP